MNGTPPPTTAQLRAIKARIERAVQNDPVDALLADYRALTIEDVLRVDVHLNQRHGESSSGIDPGNARRSGGGDGRRAAPASASCGG